MLKIKEKIPKLNYIKPVMQSMHAHDMLCTFEVLYSVSVGWGDN